MNIAGIIHESLIDGVGVRMVVFISGCKHNCQGCHNIELKDFNYGKKFDEQTQDYIIKHMICDPLLSGITISGGDPIYSELELIPFLKRIKYEVPEKTIWLYTGFSFEEIKNLEIIQYIDVLVDGEFVYDKYDRELCFKGSSNQRIIDIKKTLFKNEITLWECQNEY